MVAIVATRQYAAVECYRRYRVMKSGGELRGPGNAIMTEDGQVRIVFRGEPANLKSALPQADTARTGIETASIPTISLACPPMGTVGSAASLAPSPAEMEFRCAR
jgi:hypothetical protein